MAAVGRHVGLAALGNAFPPLAGVVVLPLLARGLGVVGRGDAAAATAPLLLLTAAATLGLPESLTYHAASRRRLTGSDVLRAVWLAVLAALVGALAVALLAGLLSGGRAEVARDMGLAILALPLTMVVGVLRGVAAGGNLWGLVAIERSAGAAVRVVGLVLLTAAGELTVTWAVLVLAWSPVLGGLAYIRVLRRLGSHAGIVLTGPSVGYRPLVDYAVRIWLGSLSGVLLMRLDQLLMTPLSSTYQLGLYAVAASVSELPLIVNSAFRDVAFSAASGSVDQIERITRMARLSTGVCLAAAGVILAAVPLWLTPLLGDDFSAAVPALVVLSVAVVAGTPGALAGAGLSGAGAPHLRSVSLTLGLVVNAVLVVALVPAGGAVGAAVATVAGNLVSSTANIIFYTRRLGARSRDFYGLRRSDVTALARLVPGRRG